MVDGRRRFKVILVKPSHYDEDGYVIQWLRSTVPSNSLASVHGLIIACASESMLGPDVDIDVDSYDECNTVIRPKDLAAQIHAAGAGFIGLVGVQSNQFPRALDLARKFRALGVTVVVGGFHVSGCLAMLPDWSDDIRTARDLGVIVFAGECEGRMAALIKDIAAGTPKPVYNFMDDLPNLDAAALPILPRPVVSRVAGHYASFDAGRGCPFQCSFCTIINVQGRKSRYRSADDVERIVREYAALGITSFFVTDDNFARNRNWEPILDRLIKLREKEKMRIRLLLQVDTLCHRIPHFIEKAARAGCTSVFIGLENINPQSLMGAKKRQNKIWEYRAMLQAWRSVRVMTFGGYILGFPSDTPESIAKDIAIIQRELPIDLLEFFFLTPLPGSEDHKILVTKGVAVDPDMNKYDLEHACTAHATMSRATWEKVYRDAWTQYYSDAHVETLLRRAAKSGLKLRKLVELTTVWAGASRIEGVHPLQFGYVRIKRRLDRRRGLPIESALVFYPKLAAEYAGKLIQWARLLLRYRALLSKVRKDPDVARYQDAALAVSVEEDEKFVDSYVDVIPRTHGAPAKKRAPA